jgi:type I restriction enzyme M protein
MPSKRDLLAHLTRDELKDIVDHFGLNADGRSPASLLEAIAASKKAKLPAILGGYLHERLTELCEALGLDSSGNKSALVERLTGKASPTAESAEPATKPPERPTKQAKQAEPATTTPRMQRGPLTLPQLERHLFAAADPRLQPAPR